MKFVHTKLITGIILIVLLLVACSSNEKSNTLSTSEYPSSQWNNGDIVEITIQIPQYQKPQKVKALVQDGLLFVDTDIAFNREEILNTQAYGVVQESHLWSNGIIPYVVDTKFSQEAKDTINQAVNHWNEKTNVSFVRRVNENEYLNIVYSDSLEHNCHISFVGFNNFWESKITFTNKCAEFLGGVVHELGHAVGLFHEQRRPDRDKYIEVLYANIDEKYHFAYDKLNSDDFAFYEEVETLTTYDHYSIMHYDAYAFAKEGLVAMKPLGNNVPIEDLGQSARLTGLDIQAVNRLYPKLLISEFDGAGSIIRTNNNCWGCNKDEARMQAHNVPSTVVFQWTATSNCSYLKVGVADGAGIGNIPLDVVVHTKRWNDQSSDTAYKATLPITVSKKDYWNTTAITSQQSLSTTIRLIAKCANEQIPFSKANIDNEFVQLVDNYYWAGNGSLIAKDNIPDYNTEDAGVRQDWAIAFNQHKAMSIFQWQPSEACSSLLIDTKFGGDDDDFANVNQVDIKPWSATSWSGENLCSQLPCIIDDPSNGNYYILKIKTNAGAVKSGYIHASCK